MDSSIENEWLMYEWSAFKSFKDSKQDGSVELMDS